MDTARPRSDNRILKITTQPDGGCYPISELAKHRVAAVQDVTDMNGIEMLRVIPGQGLFFNGLWV